MTENNFALIRHDGQIFHFGSEGLTFGRSQTNQIIIPHPSVSRLHARILISGGQCWLRDENSAGGVLINNRRMQGQGAIQINDVITIGNASFRLIPAQPAPQQRERGPVQESTSTKVSQKHLPVFIGGGLVLILGLVMILAGSGGLSPGSGDSSANEGSSVSDPHIDPKEQAVTRAQSALNAHPDFVDHLVEYQEAADQVDSYITFEAEAQSLIGLIDLLKTLHAWDLIINAANLSHPGGGEAIEVLDRLLREMLDIKGNLDQVYVMEDTRQAGQSFISHPTWDALLALDATLGNSMAVLKSLQGDIEPILTKTTQALEQVELAMNVAGNLSQDYNIGALNDFSQGANRILESVQDLHDFLFALDQSVSADLELMSTIQSITDQAR